MGLIWDLKKYIGFNLKLYLNIGFKYDFTQSPTPKKGKEKPMVQWCKVNCLYEL